MNTRPLLRTVAFTCFSIALALVAGPVLAEEAAPQDAAAPPAKEGGSVQAEAPGDVRATPSGVIVTLRDPSACCVKSRKGAS